MEKYNELIKKHNGTVLGTGVFYTDKAKYGTGNWDNKFLLFYGDHSTLFKDLSNEQFDTDEERLTRLTELLENE